VSGGGATLGQRQEAGRLKRGTEALKSGGKSMRRFRQTRGVFAALIVVAGGGLAASTGQPVTIQERARGAERVVVATVSDIRAAYETNAYGDELIVSHASLTLEEVIKGNSDKVTVAVEGGTVNGITLRVSSLPTLSRGERAVFFLNRGPSGEYLPHLKGQGILKLDATNHVKGSSLSLDDIRRMARPDAR
jgi:hypothetical protein